MTTYAPGRSNKAPHITGLPSRAPPTAGMPQLLTMSEAAAISRLSVATLRRRISEGALAAHRVGPRVLRVDRDSLLALIGSPIRGD